MLKRFKCGVMGGVLLLLAAGLLSPIIRAKRWIAIFVLCLLLTNNSFSQMRIRYGDYHLQLEIGQQVDVPIYIYVIDGGTYNIGDFCLPLGCNDDYFSSVDDFVRSSATDDWEAISGENLQLNHPENNWTTLSGLGWFSFGGPATPVILTPSNSEEIVGFMRMTVRGNVAPGFYTDVFRQSSDTYQGEANVGDTIGNMYTVERESFGINIEFVITQICSPDCPYVASGNGSIVYHNYIDVFCDGGTTYTLDDISRREGANGEMGDNQSIFSKDYDSHEHYSHPDLLWNDNSLRPAIDANVYAGFVYDFLYQFHYGHFSFQRNGWAGDGRDMASALDNPDIPDNAGYSPSHHEVCYGVVQTRPYSCAAYPFIVAHEWAHGLTHSESNLWYRSEYGALNEAFSNMTAGYYCYLDGDLTWWELGKDYNGPGNNHNDLDDPHLHNDPGAYLIDPYWQDLSSCNPTPYNDYCYVHTNCTVPELMFYLLAEGGQNPYLGLIPGLRDVTVTDIGIDNAMMIMYFANCADWNDRTDFIQARGWTIFRALEEESVFGEWSIPVSQAWEAVNVYDFSCSYIPGDCDDDSNAGTIADYNFLHEYLLGHPGNPLECELTRESPPFYPALDVNGDCDIDLMDLMYYGKYICAQHGRDDTWSFKWCQLYPAN
ncbi:MAG: M4 family metallopeptidase [candidate division Zixibacteria bacterium]|nr:M4 family metallopeptidase [candidate division Zixibacteria bacterium]